MSAFPAMMSADAPFGNPFPAFEGGFTHWDCQEQQAFVFPQQDEPILFQLEPQEPVISNSGSDNYSNPTPLDSTSGSDEPNQNNKRPNSGSDDTTNPPVDSVPDERKRRRMISNRESARRSRMRKQKHLENLRNQVNRLKIGNRELTNRLRVFIHYCEVVGSDNDRLLSESVMLRQRLWDIRQVLLVRQLQQQQLAASTWPCNNFPNINEDAIPQSLIITNMT